MEGNPKTTKGGLGTRLSQVSSINLVKASEVSEQGGQGRSAPTHCAIEQSRWITSRCNGSTKLVMKFSS